MSVHDEDTIHVLLVVFISVAIVGLAINMFLLTQLVRQVRALHDSMKAHYIFHLAEDEQTP